MSKICSQEYKQFLEEYDKFLHHYAKAERLCVLIKTLKGKNTHIAFLYSRAVKEHIAATNACLQLHTIYRLLVEKWQNFDFVETMIKYKMDKKISFSLRLTADELCHAAVEARRTATEIRHSAAELRHSAAEIRLRAIQVRSHRN
jgi:hypothetical protein